MSEHLHVNRTSGRHDSDELHEAAQQATSHQSATSEEGFDALLDEIDGLLENNAAEYVRSFVQKGGQ